MTAFTGLRLVNVDAVGPVGDRDYLVYEDERYTYEQIFRRVCTLSEKLRSEFGVRKGDRVAIAMRNYPEWVMTFWAAQAIGAVAVPLNAWWTASELRFGLEDGRARTLEEVGKEFNVTRERIRQIEAKALRKLRHPSRSRKLKDYLE